jgi:hypothetical protein
MNPPDDLLASLLGAAALFRILPPRPVSARAAHRGQKRMAFRLLSSRGYLRKWEMAV